MVESDSTNVRTMYILATQQAWNLYSPANASPLNAHYTHCSSNLRDGLLASGNLSVSSEDPKYL